MKKHLTKCQKTNSELKESMKTELREGSYEKRVPPSTWEDEAKPEAPTSDLNPALVMVKSKKAYHSQKQITISEFTEKGSFDAPLPQPRQKLVDQKLATWIYATGQYVDMVDNGYFQDFVASVRTTYAPPSRWKVGELLLDSCYDRVEAEVKGYFDRAPVLIGAPDTWNDVMGKSVTNLMLLKLEPFFLDSWMLDERRKTATNEAEKMISRLKPFEKKLVSFISDTENKMKAVLKELYQELTPETLHCLLFFFCTAHVPSLLLGDIFEQIAYFHDALDLAYFEGDQPLLQEVWPRMKSLREKVLSAIPGNLKSKTRAGREKPWSANEESLRKRVEKLYTDRWDYMHDHAHVLAYCLYSKNGVPDLNEYKRKAALNALKEMVPEKQRAQALQEYGKFRAREPPFDVGSNWFSLLVVDSLSSYGWWKAYADPGPLQNVAIALGAIPATAGATERKWNEFGQLYTRNRNRLKPERLRKLVFIYHNLRILARMKVTKEDRQPEVAASALAVSACDRCRL